MSAHLFSRRQVVQEELHRGVRFPKMPQHADDLPAEHGAYEAKPQPGFFPMGGAPGRLPGTDQLRKEPAAFFVEGTPGGREGHRARLTVE